MSNEMINIEEVNRYWDKRPCNINHSNKPLGSQEYYEEVERKKYKVEEHIPLFAEFEKWRNKEVLEIGCGIGTDSINFVRNGAKLTIIELSEKSLNITKERFNSFGLNATFILGNAEKLTSYEGITNKKFDLIYSFGVIHHTPFPDLVINECAKLLKQDGELRIMLYAKYSTKNFMINLGLAQPEAQKGCPIAYTYSYNDIEKLLKKFDIIKAYKWHIFPYELEEYKKHNYVYMWRYKFMPKFMFNILQSTFGWHYLITAKLKPISDN